MNQGNGDFFPWDEKAAMDEWYQGVYRVKVIHAEDGYSTTSNKRMPRVGFQCIEPVEYTTLTHFENYTVGTDDQPDQIVKGTMGYKSFMKLLMAAQVPRAESMQNLLISLKGAELLIGMAYKPTADFKNNITSYFRLGERPTQVQVPQVMGPVAGAAQLQPMATGAPVTTTAPAPVAQATPTPLTPPAQPVMTAPPAAPAPPVPPVPSAPSVAPTVTPQGGGETVPCTICGEQVPVAEFGAHVQAHLSAQ